MTTVIATTATTTTAAEGLDVRVCGQASHDDLYITATADRPGGGERAAPADLFGAIAAALAERGAEPVQEKIYGLGNARAGVLEARAQAYAAHGVDAALPVSYLEGAPTSFGPLAGVQLWAVAPRAQRLPLAATVECPGGLLARRVAAGDLRLLYVPGVRGTLPDGTLPRSPTEQAERMFRNAGAALRAHGMSFANVARTWIYLRRILDWYGEFNRVRTSFFREEGLFDGRGTPFPASTGIQGRAGDEECCMDLLAIQPARARLIHTTARQNEAYAYGSAFSRGITVPGAGSRTVYVSGTASIDARGHTTHRDDPEGQCFATLMAIAAVLEGEGGRLEDICLATLFCKDPAAFDAYRAIERLLHVPSIPAVPVIADVCRGDLLVEIEAVAVIPDRSARP